MRPLAMLKALLVGGLALGLVGCGGVEAEPAEDREVPVAVEVDGKRFEPPPQEFVVEEVNGEPGEVRAFYDDAPDPGCRWVYVCVVFPTYRICWWECI